MTADSYGLRPPITPMLAKAAKAPPQGEGWAYEPKWDGFRAIAYQGTPPRLDSRTGKGLDRYFPELQPALRCLPAGTVVDGEIVLVVDDVARFDHLQMRIHPAESRIKRLAEEFPARLVAFDLLAIGGEILTGYPYRRRRAQLEDVMASVADTWALTPVCYDFGTAARWFDAFESAGCDGIIAKQSEGSYQPGKRGWIKWKHHREVDCVIGGYRMHKAGDRVGSLLLGLYNRQGELHFIGHTSSLSAKERVELLPLLEDMRTEGSFGGVEARSPGGGSRWTSGRSKDWIPIAPDLVVEVRYDQLTGGRFRHATRLRRWRPDKAAADCTMDQLVRPQGAGFSEIVG